MGEGPKGILKSDIAWYKKQKVEIEKKLAILNGRIKDSIKTTNNTASTNQRIIKGSWVAAKEKEWRKSGKEG